MKLSATWSNRDFLLAVSGIATTWTRGDPMYFEFLIEDSSGKVLLDKIVPKIIGTKHSFRVISYKGIGHVPKHLNGKPCSS